MNYFSPTENWFNFCVLLIALFLLKGVVYLSIMPPFEGWDEYQHLAYISYLDKYHERPILNNAFVSRDVLKQIVQFPVSQSMLDQTRSVGTVHYKTFFDPAFSGVQYNDKHHNIPLYQAQHGSLYYRLILPVTKIFSSDTNLLSKIFTLRFINILFVTASLAIILGLINQIVTQKNHAAVIALLLICQPLLLINSARVANDAFAILTGTGVIAIGLLPSLRNKFAFSVITGMLIGISCWAKSISTILFPFWICSLCISWHNKEISFKKMMLCLIVSNVIAFLILKEYFFFNIDNYGMLFVMQEAIVNSNNNRSFVDILKVSFESPMMKDIFCMWSKVWIGGWSFLKVSNVNNISFALIVVSFLGWAYNSFSKEKSQGVISLETSLLCFSTCFFTSLALSWHYLQSTLAWGQATTCVWYISITLPFFLLFVYDSASHWSGRTSFIIGSLLTITYIYADIRGSLTMISFYSGGANTSEALSRIASIHPASFNTTTLLVAAALFLCLLSFLFAIVLQCNRMYFRR
ncbi:MAG: hypothetical protein V8K32_09400 [Candidatus Electrothrix gigas]